MNKPESDLHPFQIALITLAGSLSENPGQQPIASLEDFPAEWNRLEFTYQGLPAVLVRIPKPEKTDDGLEVSPGFYLSAYLLICPHQGCVVQTHRGNPQKLVCRCQGDVYWAIDGTLVAGLANQGLQRIALEVVGKRVYATVRHKTVRGPRLMKSKFQLKLTMG